MSIKNMQATLRSPVFWILLLAALLRLLLLGMKPPHFDEGVNGWFVDEMTHKGFYHYDPANYHGPLHFYILFLFQTLLGRSVRVLRLPLVLISLLSIFWVTKFDRFLNRNACLLAALGMAISPGVVFYSRYAIHEPEFVFFQILLVWGLFGLWRSGEKVYLRALGLSITGLILTKETYVIHFTAFALAFPSLLLLEKFSPSESESFSPQKWSWRDLAKVIGVCVVLILFFYSGGFLDFSSLRGLYETYAAWFQTGTEGHGHEKAFYYWLKLMGIYEWIALCGLVGVLGIFRPRANRMIRYLAICACGTLVAYSIVRYKTPWCIVTIIWPFFFVFGELASGLINRKPRLAMPLLVLICMASTAKTVSLNFFRYTNEDEPYVYVQTLPEIARLTDPLFKLVAEDPDNYHISGHILLSSYHPLPWVLGDFTAIGYYGSDSKPDIMDADFVLVDESQAAETEKSLHNRYFTTTFKLRGAQEPSKLYLSFDKFQSLFSGRKPEFTPTPVIQSAP